MEVIESDVFRTVIPLTPIAVEKVGPKGEPQVAPYDTPHDRILAFCSEPRSKSEIMQHCGYQDSKHFTQKYLKPLLESGQLQMTLPDKPQSHNQKYVTIQGGQQNDAAHLGRRQHHHRGNVRR